MFQESRTGNVSPPGPRLSAAVSSRYSGPKAIAAEENGSDTRECRSSNAVFPKLLFISGEQKTGISMALEKGLF